MSVTALNNKLISFYIVFVNAQWAGEKIKSSQSFDNFTRISNDRREFKSIKLTFFFFFHTWINS